MWAWVTWRWGRASDSTRSTSGASDTFYESLSLPTSPTRKSACDLLNLLSPRRSCSLCCFDLCMYGHTRRPTLCLFCVSLFYYKVCTQCQTIAAETVQNNNRHWRRPTQVLKHLRVALKHKHDSLVFLFSISAGLGISHNWTIYHLQNDIRYGTTKQIPFCKFLLRTKNKIVKKKINIARFSVAGL